MNEIPTETPLEKELIKTESLVEINRPQRALASKRQWGTFIISLFVGALPLTAGVIIGVTGVVVAFRDSPAVPWWMGVICTFIIILCVITLVINLYGLMEGVWFGLILGLVSSCLAWPVVGIMAYALSHMVAPATTGGAAPLLIIAFS